MLSTYSIKRGAIPVVTMILATLTVAIMTPSASAQEITTIADARPYLTRGNTFLIDTGGLGGGEYSFRITTLNDDGTFVGLYFRSGIAPKHPNVTGQITMVRGHGIAATRISFVADVQTVAGIGIGGTEFEGAIRFANTHKPNPRAFSFMAGTFTFITPDGRPSGGWGPFPFTALSNKIN